MPKRLKRNTKTGLLTGVCAGIGDYTDTDPTWWRLLLIVLFFPFPFIVLVYFILALVMDD